MRDDLLLSQARGGASARPARRGWGAAARSGEGRGGGGWGGVGGCLELFSFAAGGGAPPGRAVGGSWRTRADLEADLEVCPTSFGYRVGRTARVYVGLRSEEHTSEIQ